MPYSLFDRAFYGWLASSDREMRLLLAAFEQIGENPVGCAHGAGRNRSGMMLHVHDVGRFRIHYRIPREGPVQIIDVLHRREDCR
ncbi:MAG: type II toxin-antitoxin system RelE/ParE family toxin [Chthoniobacteraceae bacterium]